MAKKVQVVIFHKGPPKEVLILRMKEDRECGLQNVTGSVDGDETFLQAARRELLEETGIEANPIETELNFTFHDRWERDVQEKVFYVSLERRPEKISISRAEHQEYLWVPLESVNEETYLHPSNFKAFNSTKGVL